MDAAGWANVIAVLALLGAGLGWWSNRRGNNATQQLAERTAAAQERTARAVERQQKAFDASQQVAWSVQPEAAQYAYVLQNVGSAAAHEVTVRVPTATAKDHAEEIEVRMVPAQGTVAFDSLLAMTMDDTLVVRWVNRPGEPVQEWKRRLPKHPPGTPRVGRR